MKKIIFFMLIIIAIYANVTLASVGVKDATLNYVGIQIEIDENKIIPKDVSGNVVEPFIIDGTTYLPVRAISEALGKNVEWDSETYSVYVTDPSEEKIVESFSGEVDKKFFQETKTLNYKDISIYINEELIEPKDANGNVVEPFIIDGTTYLPVRAVAEAFDKEVDWLDETKTVMISTKIAKIQNVVVKIIDDTLCAEVTTDIPLKNYNYYSITEGKVVAEPYLNMRDSSNVNSNIITTIPNDSVITIKDVIKAGNLDSWYKVKYADNTGWVSAEFVEITPTRLVIDLENTKFEIDTTSKDINYEAIESIRFGDQGNDVSRIVLDLNQMITYSVVQNQERNVTYFALSKDFELPSSIKGEEVFVATNDDKLYIPKDDENIGDENDNMDEDTNTSVSGDTNLDDNVSGDIDIIIGEDNKDEENIEDENQENNNDSTEDIIENLSSVNSVKYSSSTNKTKIKIDGDYEYTAFTLTNPDRVVIDIKGAKLNVDGPKEINPNNKNITAIRFSQNEQDIVRIVFDVNSKSDYVITEKKSELTVELEETTYKNIDYINYDTYSTLILKDTDIDYFETEKASTGNKYYITYSSRKFKSGTGSIEIDDEWVDEIEIKSAKITIYGKEKTNYSIKQNGDDVIITMKEQITENKVILIDAGHGGKDPGACNGTNYEKIYNLDIALKLYDMLKETDGIEVRMTRTDDTYMDRFDRFEIIKENEDADFLVSIHNNSLANKNYQGTMVLFYDKPGEKEEYGITSKEIATIVKEKLVEGLGTIDRGIVSRKDLLILEQNVTDQYTAKYGNVGNNNLPAILCEVVFMSNDEELAKLKTESFRQKAAQAIYDGIIETVSMMD